MQLPRGLTLSLMQTKWAGILNPLLGNPSLQSSILTGIALVSGSNVINHQLGRKLVGWRIIRIRASATIYDLQDTNTMPELTLLLHASADVTIDLEVF